MIDTTENNIIYPTLNYDFDSKNLSYKNPKSSNFLLYTSGIFIALNTFSFSSEVIDTNYSIDFECVNKYSKLNEKIELYSSQEYEQVLLNLVNYIEKNSIDIDEEIYEYIEDNFWDFIWIQKTSIYTFQSI